MGFAQDLVPSNPVTHALNTIAGDTLGVLWSAASGTVDPWTEANIIADSGTGSLGSAASPATAAAVAAQAAVSVPDYLASAGADSTQFSTGVANSIGQLNPFNPNSPFNPANWSQTEILLIGGLIVIAILIFGFAVRR